METKKQWVLPEVTEIEINAGDNSTNDGPSSGS